MNYKYDFIHVSQWNPPAFGQYCRVTIDIPNEECNTGSLIAHATAIAASNIPWVGAFVKHQFEQTAEEIIRKNKGFGVIVRLFLPVVAGGIAWNEVESKELIQDFYNGRFSGLRVELRDTSTSEKVIGDGWERLRVDLNMGAGGKYLYFNYKPDNQNSLTNISALKVIASPTNNIPTPEGFEKIETDLNATVGGDYIFAYFKRGIRSLSGIGVIAGDDSNISLSGFTKIHVDLNKNAKGKYIYLAYKGPQRFVIPTERPSRRRSYSTLSN